MLEGREDGEQPGGLRQAREAHEERDVQRREAEAAEPDARGPEDGDDGGVGVGEEHDVSVVV